MVKALDADIYLLCFMELKLYGFYLDLLFAYIITVICCLISNRNRNRKNNL